MHIFKCKSCTIYTLNEVCSCGSKSERVVPPKFSLEDKYAKYRRQARVELKNGEKAVD